MKVPTHYLHIYQKPKAGSGFLDRFKVYAYQHKISAIGGFDTASMDIVPRGRADRELFASQYLGNRIAIIVDNPLEPAFEGYINRITFSAGASAYTISLDEMSNRTGVKYVLAGVATESLAVNNTESQAIYGIKQSVLDIGSLTGAGTSRASTYNTLLANAAWPKTSRVQNTSGLIHIEVNGFYHTLDWQTWDNTSASVVSLYSRITNGTNGVLPNLANGATFFDNTDFTDIFNNTATAAYGDVSGKTLMEIMIDIQAAGNGTNQFVFGITPTSPVTGLRRMYYRAANSEIEYTVLKRDDMRVRDLYGKLVRPWTVQPDAGIQVSDWLIGGAVRGDDPRETYITDITYVADTQSVNYSGGDDATIEGVFGLRRRLKSLNKKRFGANSYRL